MRIFAFVFIGATFLGCSSPEPITGHGPERSHYGGKPLQIEPSGFSTYGSTMISVEVRGEVLYPQTVSLRHGSKVADAIHEAGGFKEFGGQTRVEVRRNGGPSAGGTICLVNMNKVRKDWRCDLTLENGDIVYVPRVHRIF